MGSCGETSTIKDDLLDLGERLCAYHDWMSWQSTNPNHPQPKDDLLQAVEEYEEYAFLRFEITQDHDLWKPFKVKGRFDFFRLRVISLLASKVASGNSLCPPVLDIVKTCRSLGDENDDLDTALKKIVAMVSEGLISIEERMPPYLISSHMMLAPTMLETFASKVCLLRPSEIPVAKPKAKKSRRRAEPQGPASPEDIYNKLREYVVDQDEAAKTLACRGYMHLQRAKLIQKGETSGFNQCILMLGRSGVGKTYLAECFGTIAQVPFASVSMTEMTGTGFVGMDICDDGLQCLRKHPLAAGSVERARFGILFLDEIDKKASRSGIDGLGVATSTVQHEILRLVEGTSLSLGHSNRNTRGETFNSDGLMTVMAGAFSGLQREIQMVSHQDTGIGFGHSQNPARASVYLKDALISYGLIPELVNRITGFCVLKDLTVESLERILMAKHGVLSAYNEMLKPQKLAVDLEPEAIRALAEFAYETKTQARGLRTGLGLLLEDAIFCQVQGKMVFSKSDVENALMESCMAVQQ